MDVETVATSDPICDYFQGIYTLQLKKIFFVLPPMPQYLQG